MPKPVFFTPPCPLCLGYAPYNYGHMGVSSSCMTNDAKPCNRGGAGFFRTRLVVLVANGHGKWVKTMRDKGPSCLNWARWMALPLATKRNQQQCAVVRWNSFEIPYFSWKCQSVFVIYELIHTNRQSILAAAQGTCIVQPVRSMVRWCFGEENYGAEC